MRHRWLHTAVVTLLVWAVVTVAGVAAGLLLLVLFTGLPLWAVTGIAMLVETTLMPAGAAAMTLLYGDARAATAAVT